MALTVTRSTDVNPNAIRTDVDTLSQGWCRSRSGHCTNDSECDQRCFNPHELLLSVLLDIENTQGAGLVPTGTCEWQLGIAKAECEASWKQWKAWAGMEEAE